MKIELTDDQLKKQMEFHQFVDDYIVPGATESDKEEKMNPVVLEKLIETGYIGSMLPKKYGGLGMDMVTLGILIEELARGCSSARILLTVHGMVALGIMRWGSKEQKEFWLPKLAKGEKIGAFGLTEPDVGSDAKNVESTAERDGDFYIINGQKKWISMAQIADVFLIFAQCEGQPTAFLVEKDTEGLSINPMKGLLGYRSSMVGEVKMENCRIPVGNILCKVGAGLSHVALSCLDYGRYTVAWGCVGLGQACFEESVKYAKTRKQFGAPLQENQLIKKMITEMIVNVKAARQLCYKAGYLKDIGDPDTIMETWVAKYFSSNMITKVASDAVQIHGGNGCHNSYPIERFFRDAKINEIIEGTSQMHEILIASYAFRNY
ncbi:MAG: acyl-CoA dehydrogenase family protein [Halanaerobiales bacterium]|nr:acyl-CoA dehydrogenase family protein [Halanaerobiales bacterium]